MSTETTHRTTTALTLDDLRAEPVTIGIERAGLLAFGAAAANLAKAEAPTDAPDRQMCT